MVTGQERTREDRRRRDGRKGQVKNRGGDKIGRDKGSGQDREMSRKIQRDRLSFGCEALLTVVSLFWASVQRNVCKTKFL